MSSTLTVDSLLYAVAIFACFGVAFVGTICCGTSRAALGAGDPFCTSSGESALGSPMGTASVSASTSSSVPITSEDGERGVVEETAGAEEVAAVALTEEGAEADLALPAGLTRALAEAAFLASAILAFRLGAYLHPPGMCVCVLSPPYLHFSQDHQQCAVAFRS